MMREPLVQWQTRQSEPVSIDGNQVSLASQTLVIRFPGKVGGIVWNRPAGVSVTRPDGSEQVAMVRDVTRLVQIGLFAIALFVLALVPIRQSS